MSSQLASLPWQCGGVASNVWRSVAAVPLLGRRGWSTHQITPHTCLQQTCSALTSQCSHDTVKTSHCQENSSVALQSQHNNVDGLLDSFAIIADFNVTSNIKIENLLRHHNHTVISEKKSVLLRALDAVTNLPGRRLSLQCSSVYSNVAMSSQCQAVTHASSAGFLSSYLYPTTSVRQYSSSHQSSSFKSSGSLHASTSLHLLSQHTTTIAYSNRQSSRHYCWTCSPSLVTPSLQPSRPLSLSAPSLKDSSAGSRSASLNVFDRHTKLLQKERVAAREDAHLFDYLKDEVGFRLADRIFDIKKEFKVGLDLGCGRGHLSKHLTDASLQRLIMSDCSPGLLASAAAPSSPGLTVERQHVDEEQPLPFGDASLDLVLSNLSLNWVNNLPGCLREVHRSLRADGTLLASMFGGDTLYQLRSALLLAEMERQGGVSAHVSPFTKVQDIGALLNQAGFEMLTIDTDDFTVGYPSMWELLWDLQGMAESNASVGRCLHLPRDTLMAAAAIYQELYGDDKGVPATFEIIYMIGWKPDPNNVAVPAARGSGQVSLKDIGRLEELVRERGLQGKIHFIEELEKGGRDPKGNGGSGQDK